MMLASDPTSGQLDPYNQEDPFNIRGGTYGRTFAQRLTQFDAYDGKTDWKPHTCLEIERATLTGQVATTCGGRMPNEDAMDVTLNFLIRGPSASAQDREAIRDGDGF